VWERYTSIFVDSFSGYGRYLWSEISHPSWHSYFYGLLLVSLVVYGLELAFPWRKTQPRLRKDFWLDGFYMFFNFFLFSLIGYNAASNIAVEAFADLRHAIGIGSLSLIDVAGLSIAAQLAIMFVARDFIEYWIHRLLHRVPRLWSFHKVHHSVMQMGFAAHLRYHWMETIVYRSIEYIPLAMLGFGIQEFFVVHMLALTIGHINHANFRPPIGPLRYLINSPQMHIWHHAKEMPRRYGANYGLSLSVWDWLFGTVYWPRSGRDIPLGFEHVEDYPDHFLPQMVVPFRAKPGP
jgi:sterol desaturase/sphingolipid hydroxylase (fatty acid hydroxylase superfamily)